MKKIIISVLVAVTGLFVGYNVCQEKRINLFSDLTLANVEALASNESGSTIYCCGNYGDCIVAWNGSGYTVIKGVKLFSPCL